MRFRKLVSVLVAFTFAVGVPPMPADSATPSSPPPVRASAPPKPPLVEQYLIDGKLTAGETALRGELKTRSGDDQVRFGLGVLQFVRAVERLAQDLYRYGLRGPKLGPRLPILRMPVPANEQPAALSYNDARQIAKRFAEGLNEAELTLAQINDPNVNLPLHFGLIRLDLNGDGRGDDAEALWKIYASLAGGASTLQEEQAKQFYIRFDRGDVHWLRGYCHLLKAICEIYLAHDSRETFDTTAHLFFKNVVTPYKFLTSGKRVRAMRRDATDILDTVALIHTISWPVVEPQRMRAALADLQACVGQSKESWKFIMAETDNDREWLPNPRQTSVVPNMPVTDDMVTQWMSMMDEINRLLSGEVLIPFWRGGEGVGVNVNKVFTQPQKLDLVLWVQGTGAAPFLEPGKMSDISTWRAVRGAFGSQFPGYAIWFN